jgi:Arc/MetJ-type ribon-helix-helix transcriptional regulator
MKISVNLPADDVAFLDAYAAEHAGDNRSAAVHEAIETLRRRDIGAEYQAAFQEWNDSGEAQVWDAVGADGLSGSVARCGW